MAKYYYREYIKKFTREGRKSPFTIVFTYLNYSIAGVLLDIKTGYDVDLGERCYRAILDANEVKERITVNKWEI